MATKTYFLITITEYSLKAKKIVQLTAALCLRLTGGPLFANISPEKKCSRKMDRRVKSHQYTVHFSRRLYIVLLYQGLKIIFSDFTPYGLNGSFRPN